MLDVRVEENSLDVGYSFSEDKDIIMRFEKCMFNNLMTFSQASLQNKKNGKLDVLNKAYSDNIGPMKVAGSSYVGGNHSYSDNNFVADGTEYRWHGLYTWFEPVVDDEDVLIYEGADVSGRLLFVSAKKIFRESGFCPTIQTSVFL